MGASGEFHAVLPLWSACVYLSVSHSPLHLPPQCPCKLPLHWPHGGWIIWDLAGDVGLQLRESSQWSAAGRRRARGCSSSRLLRGTARRYRRGLHCGQGGGWGRRGSPEAAGVQGLCRALPEGERWGALPEAGAGAGKSQLRAVPPRCLSQSGGQGGWLGAAGSLQSGTGLQVRN